VTSLLEKASHSRWSILRVYKASAVQFLLNLIWCTTS
jgi:hypothetical protein